MNQYHYRAMHMFATDDLIEQCGCGATFDSLDAIQKHLDENPNQLFEINDGVTRCKECDEPTYMKGKPECQSHPTPMVIGTPFPNGPPKTISTFDLGRAGVGIERAAHENTLELLRRARNLLSAQKDNEMIQLLLADIKKQCPVLTEHKGPDCQAVEGTPYCQCGYYDELLGDNEEV